MNLLNAGLFTLAAVVLLGSPGPGIAALVAVGKGVGLLRGLRFYGGLQLGLALAAAISAGGLFSLLAALPAATHAMTIVAMAYLLVLAYRIGAAPVGAGRDRTPPSFATTALAGFLLGVTNPKAYIAFISLMASYQIVSASASGDVALKWLICVVVMIIVDIAWLALGGAIRRTNPPPLAERLINLAMGGTIAATALLAIA